MLIIRGRAIASKTCPDYLGHSRGSLTHTLLRFIPVAHPLDLPYLDIPVCLISRIVATHPYKSSKSNPNQIHQNPVLRPPNLPPIPSKSFAKPKITSCFSFPFKVYVDSPGYPRDLGLPFWSPFPLLGGSVKPGWALGGLVLCL